jgi:hypothetical protein
MIEPPKRTPRWLTIDAVIFAAGLVIMGVGIYIANARISGSHLDQARDDSVRAEDTF